MIRFHDPHAIKLIAQAAHIQYVPQLHYCIADYDNNDRLRGGTLYTDFWGGSIMCHFAGFRKGWISKQLLWLGFDFPFNQLKVKKLFGIIPEWNWQSRNLALHLGYTIDVLLDDVFDFTHGVNGMYVVSMRRENCRWLNMPKPHIELAPMNLTNRPLAMVESVGTMQ